MTTVRIEHPVPTFEAWKKAFDSDPLRREASGVRRYRVLRPVDDPHFVAIDLEFDDAVRAEAFRAALLELWHRVPGSVMRDPRVQVWETAESREFPRP